MSGWARWSQANSLSSRARTELTFQVAIFMAGAGLLISGVRPLHYPFYRFHVWSHCTPGLTPQESSQGFTPLPLAEQDFRPHVPHDWPIVDKWLSRNCAGDPINSTLWA